MFLCYGLQSADAILLQQASPNYLGRAALEFEYRRENKI